MPPYCFGDGEPEEPELARLLHEIVWNRVVLLDPARARIDFLLQETPQFVAELGDFS